ncbi:hypothetical protein PoB_000284300 [Plakobranchus ocellatus]|uniref:Uncharacterized protein n=1 Tax=Plakobranchus ocellatus TaxID=259542 RepID=A0AAV3Y124_9GAST|nr:hypothetical protein PoB_000284300 [Plakobranchus ocellatus]
MQKKLYHIPAKWRPESLKARNHFNVYGLNAQKPNQTNSIFKPLHIHSLFRPCILPYFIRGVGGTVASESALRSAGTLLSRVRAPPPTPWPVRGPESLRSPCCGLAIYKNQTKPTYVGYSILNIIDEINAFSPMLVWYFISSSFQSS